MKNKIFLFMICLISGAVSAQVLSDQNTGIDYSVSPYVNSLGGASINLLNEEALMFNPGAMAVFHSDKLFSISFPFNTDYASNESDINERHDFSVSVGITLNQALQREDEPLDFGIAFGYAKSKSTQKYTMRNFLDLYDYQRDDNRDCFSFGAMMKSQIFRIGLGYTQIETITDIAYSNETDDQSFEEISNEYGLYIDAPIFLGEMTTGSLDYVSVSLTPSIAFSRKNLNIDIDDAQAASYIGFSALLEGKKERFNEFSLMLVAEYDKPDSYTDTVEVIIFPVVTEHEFEWRTKWGIELGIYDMVSLRFGRNESFDDAVIGFGISTKRIINSLIDTELSDEWWRKILYKLDIKYNMASMPSSFNERTTMHKLSLSY